MTVTFRRYSSVTTGPLGERIIALVEKYYPYKNEIYVTAGTDGDHGASSHHYGLSYGGSPTAAIDFGAYDDAEPNDKDQRDMGLLADWLFENFWDLTVELIHYQPHNDHVTMVRNQQKVSGYGSATDQAHVNHVHFATSAALMDKIEARAAQRFGSVPAPIPAPAPSASTLYGYDGSDFSSVMNFDGLTFVTHKATETDSSGKVFKHYKFGQVMNAAKNQGIPFLGAYVVPRTGVAASVAAQNAIDFVNQQTPGLMDHPGFFWQVDLEKWPYDAVSASVGTNLAVELKARTGKPVTMYASKGQYGDSVPAGFPWWNANYNNSGASRPFKQMYAGDSAPGWVTLSDGRTPLILQYCSDAIFADGNKGDANVFRGTVDDFRSKILGQTGQPVANKIPIVTEYAEDGMWLIWRMDALVHARDKILGGPEKDAPVELVQIIKDTNAKVAALQPAASHDAAILAKLDALTSQVAALQAKVNAVFK